MQILFLGDHASNKERTMRNSRIVILGCGGYIGSHLLGRLLGDNGNKILGWDLDSRKIREHVSNPDFEFRQQDLSTAESRQVLRTAIRDADMVINLAAICNPAEYNTKPIQVLRANLFDLYPIIDMCAEYGTWLMHFSTSEVYGRTVASYVPNNSYEDPDLYVLDETRTPLIMGPIQNQRWTYASAKQIVERLIFAHYREAGLPFTIIRPLNFFGPKMDYLPGHDGEGIPRVLACFMTALIDRVPMQLVDGGTARRTILSIDDAMNAIMLMLQNPGRSKNHIFNLGNPDSEVTIRELALLMRRIYASITDDATYLDHPVIDIPAEAFYGPGYEDCDRRMPNIGLAKQLLGWSPEKSLEQTMYETMTAYRKEYVIRDCELAE
jgi:UDP-apiose/xylose synthase